MVSAEEFCNFCERKFLESGVYVYAHYKTKCRDSGGNLIMIKYELSIRLRSLEESLSRHENDKFFGVFSRDFNAHLNMFKFLAYGEESK